MKRIAIACLAVMVFGATSAMALPFKPWLGISGSVTTYEMGDINSQISDIDLTNLDEIGNGFAFGVDAGIGVSPMLSLTAGYQFMSASSDLDAGLGLELDYNLPAHAFRGGLELRPPTPGPLKLGAGALVGVVSAAGDVLQAGIPGFTDVVGEVSGSGPMFEGYAVADLWFTPIMALSPAVGYRYAKISEVKLNDTVVQNLDGSDLSLDYSGYYLRLGLKLSLP